MAHHRELRAIFLVGFMGAGKTSVGKALAQKLDWAFEDLDDRIQAREGRSIETIFLESGEAGFRRAEHAALRELMAELGSVRRIVALGGGAFVQPENSALVSQDDFATIFLDGTVEELFERCQRQDVQRPLRRNLEQFRQLYESRRPLYRSVHIRIDTSGKDIQTVAAETIAALELV